MLYLCRALLALLAVSCTLSEIHANGPSTQRLDRIKDLMCVLLLSGIQKEDLDANMLNKLQRHNVNIHDLNNNELLHECTTFKTTNNNNITPRIHQIETKNNLNTIIIPEISEQNTGDNYNSTDVNAQEYDNFNKNYFKSESNENKHLIQYKDGQPELKSILKFWQDMKNNNSMKNSDTLKKLNTAKRITHENVRPEQKNKRNVPDESNSNESDIIQRLLLNFILKNQNRNLDKAVTKKNINTDDLYSDVYFNKKNKNIEINENYKMADIPPNNIEETQLEHYSVNNIPINNKIDIKMSDTIRERQKPINSRNFNDIINALQTLKINYPMTPKDSIEYKNRKNKEIMTSSENLYINKYSKHKNFFTTDKITTAKIEEQTISQNVIKEIAKSVKELVLRDLRKEILETTSTTTTHTKTTTAREETIPTVRKGIRITEQSILNKFMDLFQEIKTLNLKTVIISSETKKGGTNKLEPTIPPIFKGEQQIHFKTKQYPNTQNIFNFTPQEHKFRTNVLSESVVRVPVKTTLPITVQTNNMEIPPLGIPVDRPENPINQNIIVSTFKPHITGEHKGGFKKIKLTNSRIDFLSKPTHIRLAKPQEPTFHYPNQNDKMLPLNKDFNYDTIYNEKITLNGYRDSVHRSDEVKHFDVPRFHEKLEMGVDYYDIPRKEYKNRVDCCDSRYASSKQMVECCHRKIASRQQMSLHNAKKQRSYDDTHFKNFLKSQQKVTDMLERILASRSRVRSVEIA